MQPFWIPWERFGCWSMTFYIFLLPKFFLYFLCHISMVIYFFLFHKSLVLIDINLIRWCLRNSKSQRILLFSFIFQKSKYHTLYECKLQTSKNAIINEEKLIIYFPPELTIFFIMPHHFARKKNEIFYSYYISISRGFYSSMPSIFLTSYISCGFIRDLFFGIKILILTVTVFSRALRKAPSGFSDTNK